MRDCNPREAEAMVQTWRDSWFEEDGLRVLYVLPRPWTDQTLPMTLDPAPQQLVRVMVGRAEILTPDLQQRLSALLLKASKGEEQSRQMAEVELRKLGRFAEPAVRLATESAGSEVRDSAWKILLAAAIKTDESL